MICGGAEACICPMGISGFSAMRALSTRNDEPERASRPFDRDRDGFVMSEGAAALMLERADLARQRGAVPLARLAGYGLSCDAQPSMVLPHARDVTAVQRAGFAVEVPWRRWGS